MGIWDNVKKSGKMFIKNQKAIGKRNAGIRADNKAYEKKVQASVKEARREAYHIQAQKSARVKAKMDAERRFNPSPQQQASGGMSAEARALIYGSGSFGSPSPVKQAVQRQLQSKSPTKKKKKSTKKRSPQKPQQSQQQSDFHNLLYNS